MGHAIADIIQDSGLGQILRFISKSKIYAFPEDDPNFKVPWEQASANEKEKDIETDSAGVASGNHSNVTTPASTPEHFIVNHQDVEAHTGLSTIPTARSAAHSATGAITSRTSTLSRERTVPYTRERLEAETQEAVERQHSSIIAPERTSDGIILIDWYTTDDPANPQNWNSWKKAWVGLIIFLYTFSVYMASAIYTSAEPQVMEKFGVGQSKASLGLSMYVIGYGLGPMVSVYFRIPKDVLLDGH